MPAGLLHGVRSDENLRKVAEGDRKDARISGTARKVVYGETVHSHDVEERERAQQSSGNAWADEDQEAGGPDKAFRAKMAQELKDAMARGRYSYAYLT
jgi:hypothetical protein